MPAKKKPNEKKVAAIFSISRAVRDALNRKIPAGYRSQFVEKLIEREFAKTAAPRKSFLARILKK